MQILDIRTLEPPGPKLDPTVALLAETPGLRRYRTDTIGAVEHLARRDPLAFPGRRGDSARSPTRNSDIDCRRRARHANGQVAPELVGAAAVAPPAGLADLDY